LAYHAERQRGCVYLTISIRLMETASQRRCSSLMARKSSEGELLYIPQGGTFASMA
jgi:hypothetical protein